MVTNQEWQKQDLIAEAKRGWDFRQSSPEDRFSLTLQGTRSVSYTPEFVLIPGKVGTDEAPVHHGLNLTLCAGKFSGVSYAQAKHL